jgi:polyisoprenoid-binding protein YceI
MRFSQTAIVKGLFLGLFIVLAPAGASALAAGVQGAQDDKNASLTPVPIEDGVVTLSPENTRVEFVANHAGDEPRPRIGGFRELSGKIEVDADNETLKSIEAEVNVASVWTEFHGLTAHLKTADFLEVEDFPTAKFVATYFEPGEHGQTNVTGKMTLHGTTQEITFPAMIQFRDGGLLFRADLSLDRTNFGMDKMTEGVLPQVSLMIIVGDATKPRPSL